MAITCNFAANLEYRLKDKLISAVKNKAILDKIMAIEPKDLTFNKAVEITLASETTQKDVTVMMNGNRGLQVSSIHKLDRGRAPSYTPRPQGHYKPSQTRTPTPPNSGRRSCIFCGGTENPRNSCPAKNSTCDKCSSRGHFAKVCKKSAQHPRYKAMQITTHIAQHLQVSPLHRCSTSSATRN